MSYEERFTECADCGERLENNTKDPCPKCGSIKQNINTKISVGAKASVGISEIETKQEGKEINYLIFVIVLILTFGPPFLGLYISGWIGVAIGIIIGIIVLYLGYKYITKTRDTERQIFNN